MKRASYRRNSGSRVGGLGIILAIATVGVISVVATAQTQGNKVPSNPWQGLSDQQKQAIVDDTHKRNVQYLEEFESRHGDPRSLPVININSWAPMSSSLAKSVSGAAVVVHGRVVAVHFKAQSSGGIPQAYAKVIVEDRWKGVSDATIVIEQPGGPVAQQGSRGALVQLENEPVILAGDEVVLFLSRSQLQPEFRLVSGSPVLIVQNGRLVGESAKRYGVVGREYSVLWRALTDPQLPSGAFPLSSADV